MLASVAFAAGMPLCIPAAAQAVSARPAAAPGVPLHLRVDAARPGRDDAVTVTGLDGHVLGRCTVRGTAGGRSCAVPVPAGSGLLVVARPAAGQAWRSFRGSWCESAPGPVCHVVMGRAGRSVAVRFGPAGPGPRVTAARPFTWPHAPGPGRGGGLVPVRGAGFPAGREAVLTDDGIAVARGLTDAAGVVTLSYEAHSEPGVYRHLMIRAGGRSASTDVYNTLVWTWAEGGEGTGSVFFVIDETGLDAGGRGSYVQFGRNPPVPVRAPVSGLPSGPVRGPAGVIAAREAARGHAKINTPVYGCAPGTRGTLRLYGARGAGAQRYRYRFTIPVTC
jgi:hypothetical protein